MMESEASASPSEAPPPVTATVKTVYLIRHAQSLENQRIASMFSCFGDLGRFSLPKKSDVGASFELLNISSNADAPISELGLQQCEVMKEMLCRAKFLQTHSIELVAHSPLERARQTCLELLGCSSTKVVDPSLAATGVEEEEEEDKTATETITFTKETEDEKADTATPVKEEVPDQLLPEPVQRVVNLALLSEKTHKEWLPGHAGSFEQRVSDFQDWLGKQPESIVCVVGHSQCFKQLLGLPFKLGNVDVYQVTFESQKTEANDPIIMEHDGTADEVTLNPQWYGLTLLHSCKQQKDEPSAAAASSPGDNDDIL